MLGPVTRSTILLALASTSLWTSGCAPSSPPEGHRLPLQASPDMQTLATDLGQQVREELGDFTGLFEPAASTVASVVGRLRAIRQRSEQNQFIDQSITFQPQNTAPQAPVPTSNDTPAPHPKVVKAVSTTAPTLGEPRPKPAQRLSITARVEALDEQYSWAVQTHCPLDSTLEVRASMGKLSEATELCLTASLEGSERQTDKRRISRILIANAHGKGDTARWSKRLANHLNTIDRSDPNLAYSYAAFLARKGHGTSREVIRWANYALENKQVWSNTTYVQRVYQLHRMRTAPTSSGSTVANTHKPT